jgi:hypothetical protein
MKRRSRRPDLGFGNSRPDFRFRQTLKENYARDLAVKCQGAVDPNTGRTTAAMFKSALYQTTVMALKLASRKRHART